MELKEIKEFLRDIDSKMDASNRKVNYCIRIGRVRPVRAELR